VVGGLEPPPIGLEHYLGGSWAHDLNVGRHEDALAICVPLRKIGGAGRIRTDEWWFWSKVAAWAEWRTRRTRFSAVEWSWRPR